MGDKRRFDLFAKFVANQVPPGRRAGVRVADVAAGKGYLSWALREQGFRHIVPFEPRPRRGGQVRRLNMRVQEFAPAMARDFDVIVGMHPDAATDCILSGAAISGALAVVCPCCVRPNAWSYWGNKASRSAWVRHLVDRSRASGLNLAQTSLPMVGSNVVLWGRA